MAVSNPAILTRDDLDYIVGDFTRRRDTGDSTVFCYPQVMMTATKRDGPLGYEVPA